MVVTNFQRNSERKEIVGKVQQMVGAAGVQAEDVFTFSRYASAGVVRFATQNDKRDFKRWLMDQQLESELAAADKNGIHRLFASDSDEKEDREKKRILGKVKKGMATKKPENAKDIKVDYDKMKVLFQKKEVAWFRNGDWQLAASVEDCREAVEAAIDEITFVDAEH